MNNQKPTTFREKFLANMRSFFQFIWLIIRGLFLFLDKIKFLFVIPFASLAASIFTFIILLFGKTIIVLILPPSWQIGLIEALISTVIYIIIMVSLFRDKIFNKPNFNPQTELIGITGSLVFWIIPIFFINEFLSTWVSSYLVSMSFQDVLIEPGQAFTTILVLLFYSPHMWLSTITKNYGLSLFICMLINIGIFIVFSIRDIKINYYKSIH